MLLINIHVSTVPSNVQSSKVHASGCSPEKYALRCTVQNSMRRFTFLDWSWVSDKASLSAYVGGTGMCSLWAAMEKILFTVGTRTLLFFMLLINMRVPTVPRNAQYRKVRASMRSPENYAQVYFSVLILSIQQSFSFCECWESWNVQFVSSNEKRLVFFIILK